MIKETFCNCCKKPITIVNCSSYRYKVVSKTLFKDGKKRYYCSNKCMEKDITDHKDNYKYVKIVK